MGRAEVISKAEDLKETCRQAHRFDQRFYEEVLQEYEIHILTLKSIGDTYPWEQALEIQDKYIKIQEQLPNVTEEVFGEYILLGDLLAVLFRE